MSATPFLALAPPVYDPLTALDTITPISGFCAATNGRGRPILMTAPIAKTGSQRAVGQTFPQAARNLGHGPAAGHHGSNSAARKAALRQNRSATSPEAATVSSVTESESFIGLSSVRKMTTGISE